MNTITTAAAAAIIAQGEKSAFNKVEIVEFVAGLVEGVLLENHLSEFNTCFKDVEYDGAQMFDAVTLFAKKDLTDIMSALTHIGNVFLSMPKDLIDCTHVASNLQRIEAWATPFKNPKEALPLIWTNLLTNYVAMIHNLDTMNTKFAAHDIQGAGVSAALILELGLGPISVAEEAKDIEEIKPTHW